MPIPIIAAMAAAGLMKGLMDKGKENAERRTSAETARYSPWSKMGATPITTKADVMGSTMQGGMAGAMMGGGNIGGASGGGMEAGGQVSGVGAEGTPLAHGTNAQSPGSYTGNWAPDAQTSYTSPWDTAMQTQDRRNQPSPWNGVQRR